MNDNKLKIFEKYKNFTISKCKICSKIVNGEISIDCKSKCREKLEKALKYIEAGIPTQYFDLDPDVFPEGVDTATMLDKVKRKDIYKNFQIYYKNLEENMWKGRGLLLTGGHGTGKSTLSMAIHKKACDLGKKSIVREFAEMEYISRNKTELGTNEECDILSELVNSDIYGIEDIDWEYQRNNSDYVCMFLDNIITLAYKNNIPLIITSNMSIKDIGKNFNEHIFSLLHEICDILEVPGKDIRLKK